MHACQVNHSHTAAICTHVPEAVHKRPPSLRQHAVQPLPVPPAFVELSVRAGAVQRLRAYVEVAQDHHVAPLAQVLPGTQLQGLCRGQPARPRSASGCETSQYGILWQGVPHVACHMPCRGYGQLKLVMQARQACCTQQQSVLCQSLCSSNGTGCHVAQVSVPLMCSWPHVLLIRSSPHRTSSCTACAALQWWHR